MSELLTKISANYVKPAYTEVKVGDTVRVYTRIKEGEKERTQYFEGLVIRRRGGIGTSATFTVRRIASGVGVERNFPLHSPLIERVQIQRAAKVRRATLYTMRGLTGKAARLTEQPVDRSTRDVTHPWIAKYGIATAAEAKEATQQTAPDQAEAEAAQEPATQPEESAADVPEGDAGQDDAAAASQKTKEEAAEEIQDAPPKDVADADKAESAKKIEKAETEAEKADAKAKTDPKNAEQNSAKSDKTESKEG